MTVYRIFLVLAFCVLVAAQPAVAQFADTPLNDPALERRAHEIHKEIRCLVCQNQAISDSNADLARQLRTIVRERLATGDSDAEVRAYLVARYGDWVLMRPPLKASTVILWASPFVVLAGALLILAIVLWRRRGRQRESAPLDSDEEARLNAILDRSGR